MKKYLLTFLLLAFLIPVMVNAEEIEVTTFDELVSSISDNNTIIIKNDIEFTSLITINNNIIIKGNNYKLTRSSGYKQGLFTISATGSLTIEDLTIDGAASGWQMDYENRHYTKADNKGYIRVPTIKDTNDEEATTVLINNSGALNLSNVTIQNTVCSVSGCALSGNGNNTINNSTFKHIGSYKNGGALYLSGGNTTITSSTFKDNIAGYGVETSISGGAIYALSVASLNVSDILFEENFSQSNGGAMFISKTNLSITNSTFRHNMVGNDGSALDLENGSTTIYSISIEDSIFEKNHGFAETGQSMGTIWIGSKMNNTSETALIFKNLIFRQNIARTGGAVADNSSNTYASFENIEVYENQIGSGGFIYAQLSNYNIDGLNIHDNTGTSGSGIYVNGSNVTINNATIKDNTSTSSGAGVYICAGNIEISNSEISGNVSTNARGAGIFVRGYYEGYDPRLVLNNTVIKNNESATMGGGICVADNENYFSSIIIDNSSKIYDNKAQNMGDDFVYVRANDSINTSSNSITLDNISIAGLQGIDGWYHDNEGDRFLDTDNPTVFNNYIQYNGSGIYLKAAGISLYDYDLNGGESGVVPVVIRYGQEYVVPNDEPTKEGYDFIEWNTKEDGTGIALKAGDVYDGSDGYILYAQYIEIPRENNTIDNPPTGDNIMSHILMLILSMISLASIGIHLYKNRFN